MSHALLLFLHVAGAAGQFAALGIDGASLAVLGRAKSNDDARLALAAAGLNRVVGPVSLVLVLVPGLILWSPLGMSAASWVGPSLGGLVAVALVGGLVTGRLTIKLTKALGNVEAPLSPDAARIASARALRVSLAVRAALLVAILALMIGKPG